MPKVKTNKQFPYKRIAVIGVTGSGKSTLAQSIASISGSHYIELDALFWEPNWKEAAPADFFARVEKAIQTNGWVVAGNYRSVRPLIWSQTDAIVWLDYPLSLVFWQLTRRTFLRWWKKEELWNGNQESLWPHFKVWSDESLYNWLFKTYWARKREYPILFRQPEYAHIRIFHFRTPQETNEWLLGMH